MPNREDQSTNPETDGPGEVGGDLDAIGGVQEDLDLSSSLGASSGYSTQILRLWIPNKDRHGRKIWSRRKWVREAADLLARIGGGVTIMPPVRGGWYDEENDRMVWENPVIIYTYVKPELFRRHLLDLRRFLHRIGRETDQGGDCIRV